jgi:hypothetical protein
MKTLTIPFLFLLLSCNSLSGGIEQQVKSKVEASKHEMNDGVQKLKQDFTALYQKTEKDNVDISYKQKLQQLYNTVFTTDKYLDSIKREMSKLNEMDVQNVQQVKAIFLYQGVGDTIMKKLNASIEAAEQVAKNEQQKATIKVSKASLFNQSSNDKWKEQMFGLTNPLGVSIIIYGLQTELYNIGIKALSEK